MSDLPERNLNTAPMSESAPGGVLGLKDGELVILPDLVGPTQAAAAAALISAERSEVASGLAEDAANRIDLGALDSAVAATAADRAQVGLDLIATAADRAQTGLDRGATAADRAQTLTDKTATATDRLAVEQLRSQTGVDAAAAAGNAAASAASKTAAETARTQSVAGAATAAVAATAADAAALRAETARDAAEDSVQFTYLTDSTTTLAAITGMTTGQTAFVRNPVPEHVYRYSGSAWVDQGVSPIADKVSANKLDAALISRVDSKISAGFEGRPYLAAMLTEKDDAGEQSVIFGLKSDQTAEVFGKKIAVMDDITSTLGVIDDLEENLQPFILGEAFSPYDHPTAVMLATEGGSVLARIDDAGVGAWGFQPLGVHPYLTDDSAVAGKKNAWLMTYASKTAQLTNLRSVREPHWFGPYLRLLEKAADGVTEKVRVIGPNMGGVTYDHKAYPKVAILVGMGQSLMEGVSDGGTSVSNQPAVSPGRTMMFKAGNFSPISPEGTEETDADNRDLVTFAATVREQPIHMAGIMLAGSGLAADEGLFVTNQGRGGYNIIQLKKNGTSEIYERFIKRLESFAIYAARTGVTVTELFMCWQQGQSGGFSTEQQYRDFLLQMHADLTEDAQARFGAAVKVIIVTAPLADKKRPVGWHPGTSTDYGATGAQLWVALQHPTKFICAGPDYYIARSDGTHMLSAAYTIIGGQMARAIQKYRATAGAWRPLHISAAVRTGNQVVLTFAGGAGDLVFDEFSGTPPVLQGVRPITNKGLFWYQTGGTAVTISNVEITAPRQITITLSGDPGAVTGQWITAGLSPDFAGTNEGFTDQDPATATGGGTNIRSTATDVNALGYALQDWAVQQLVTVTNT